MHFFSDPDLRLVDSGSRMQAGEFRVRLHQLHRISARWVPRSNFDVTPIFHGHVQRQDDGFTITGVIRDTRSRGWLVATLGLVMLCGVVSLLAGLGVFGGTDGVSAAPLVVGLVLTPLFAILLAGEIRRRRPRFQRGARELEAGLQTYLRTGAAERVDA